MTGLERMRRVFDGKTPDRTPFVPSIYEHGAALIGETPTRVSMDARLMAEAAVESYRAYGHDLAFQRALSTQGRQVQGQLGGHVPSLARIFIASFSWASREATRPSKRARRTARRARPYAGPGGMPNAARSAPVICSLTDASSRA